MRENIHFSVLFYVLVEADTPCEITAFNTGPQYCIETALPAVNIKCACDPLETAQTENIDDICFVCRGNIAAVADIKT